MPDARATLFHNGRVRPLDRPDALHAAVGIRWDGVGTLAPSGHADLVVVDRDPLDCALDALSDTRVLRTVVGGSVVHDTGAL